MSRGSGYRFEITIVGVLNQSAFRLEFLTFKLYLLLVKCCKRVAFFVICKFDKILRRAPKCIFEIPSLGNLTEKVIVIIRTLLRLLQVAYLRNLTLANIIT